MLETQEIIDKVKSGNKNTLKESFAVLIKKHVELEENYESLRWKVVDYKQQANYWEARFRELKLKQTYFETELLELKGQLRRREQQLFGKRSEKTSLSEQSDLSVERVKKCRGQQVGQTSHGRRDYAQLPVTEESLELAEESRICPCCQKPYTCLPGTEDSEVVEIDVKAYRRLIRRQVYKRTCQCVENEDPQILMAPPLERVIPKSKLGISIWVYLLIHK